MDDNVVLGIITLLYVASSGGLFYLNKNFIISDKRLKQIMNWPLAKIKDGDISDILQVFKNLNESIAPPSARGIRVYEDDKSMMGSFYDNILERWKKKSDICKIHKRLRLIIGISVFNIGFSVLILFYIVYCLIKGCAESEVLADIVIDKIKIFAALLLVPWGILLTIFCFARKYEKNLSDMAKIPEE